MVLTDVKSEDAPFGGIGGSPQLFCAVGMPPTLSRERVEAQQDAVSGYGVGHTINHPINSSTDPVPVAILRS